MVKTLLTKKIYDQKRLENAIRVTAAGGGSGSPAPPGQPGQPGVVQGAGGVGVGVGAGSGSGVGGGVISPSTSSTVDRGKVDKNGQSAKPIATPASPPTAGAVGVWESGGIEKRGSREGGGGLHGGETMDEGGEERVERTELEIAAEATVVRGKVGAGRELRKELRQSMIRYGVLFPSLFLLGWCGVF